MKSALREITSPTAQLIIAVFAVGTLQAFLALMAMALYAIAAP